LRPDGTTALPMGEPSEAPPEAEGDSAARIWTPDSEQPAGGGKLWTPGA
jgi:hypothetical protein